MHRKSNVALLIFLFVLLYGSVSVRAWSSPVSAQTATVSLISCNYEVDSYRKITRIYASVTYNGSGSPDLRLILNGASYKMGYIQNSTGNLHYTYSIFGLMPGQYSAEIGWMDGAIYRKLTDLVINIAQFYPDDFIRGQTQVSIEKVVLNEFVFRLNPPWIDDISYSNAKVIINGTEYPMVPSNETAYYYGCNAKFVFVKDFGYTDNHNYTVYFKFDYYSALYSVGDSVYIGPYTFTTTAYGPNGGSKITPTAYIKYSVRDSTSSELVYNLFIRTANYRNVPPEFGVVVNGVTTNYTAERVPDYMNDNNVQRLKTDRDILGFPIDPYSAGLDYRGTILYGPYKLRFKAGIPYNVTVWVKLDTFWEKIDVVTDTAFYMLDINPWVDVNLIDKKVDDSSYFSLISGTLSIKVTFPGTVSSADVLVAETTWEYGNLNNRIGSATETDSSDSDFTDGKLYTYDFNGVTPMFKGNILLLLKNETVENGITRCYTYFLNRSFYFDRLFDGLDVPDRNVTADELPRINNGSWFVYDFTLIKPTARYMLHSIYLMKYNEFSIRYNTYYIDLDMYIWFNNSWTFMNWSIYAAPYIGFVQMDIPIYYSGHLQLILTEPFMNFINSIIPIGWNIIKLLLNRTDVGLLGNYYLLYSLYPPLEQFKVYGDEHIEMNVTAGAETYYINLTTVNGGIFGSFVYDNYVMLGNSMKSTLYYSRIKLINSGTGALPQDPYYSEESNTSSEEDNSAGLDIPGFPPLFLIGILSFTAAVTAVGIRKKLL